MLASWPLGNWRQVTRWMVSAGLGLWVMMICGQVVVAQDETQAKVDQLLQDAASARNQFFGVTSPSNAT